MKRVFLPGVTESEKGPGGASVPTVHWVPLQVIYLWNLVSVLSTTQGGMHILRIDSLNLSFLKEYVQGPIVE